MRTRFTYVALLLAIGAGATLTVTSCSPDAPAPAAVVEPRAALSVEELRDSYDWMGDYHTQALVVVQAKLFDKKNRALGKAEKCRVGIAALKEFHKTYRKNGQPLGFNDVSTVDGFCSSAIRGDQQIATSVNSRRPKPVRTELSGTAVSQMTQIEQSFDSEVPRSVLESTIYGIQSSAASSLPADEAGAVVGLGSIALSSIAYWDENIDSWGTVGPQEAYSRSATTGASVSDGIGGITAQRGLGGRARAMMKADVAAGLSTLLYEWWLGAFALEKAVIRAAAASLVAGLLY